MKSRLKVIISESGSPIGSPIGVKPHKKRARPEINTSPAHSQGRGMVTTEKPVIKQQTKKAAKQVKIKKSSIAKANLPVIPTKDQVASEFFKFAEQNKNHELIVLLMNHRLQVDVVNNNGDTALMVAIRKSAAKSAKILIDQGADVAIKNKIGESPYSLSLTTTKPEMADTCEKIQRMMQSKESRLIRKWMSLREILVQINKDKTSGQALQREVDLARAQFVKSSIIEDAQYLGTDAMNNLQNEIRDFDPAAIQTITAPKISRAKLYAINNGPLYSSETAQGRFFMRTRPNPFDKKFQPERPTYKK